MIESLYMGDQKLKVAVNVFVVSDERLLLGKRKGVGDGFWALPGGHLEYGEHLSDGAKRELLEETGLTADMTFRSIVNEYLKDDGTHYIHIQFLADNVVGEPELREPDKCYEWRWFPLTELPEEIFIGHRKVIPTLRDKQIFVD